MSRYSSPTIWKPQKTCKFSDVFRGQRKGALEANGLKALKFAILKHIFFLHFSFRNILLKKKIKKDSHE